MCGITRRQQEQIFLDTVPTKIRRVSGSKTWKETFHDNDVLIPLRGIMENSINASNWGKIKYITLKSVKSRKIGFICIEKLTEDWKWNVTLKKLTAKISSLRWVIIVTQWYNLLKKIKSTLRVDWAFEDVQVIKQFLKATECTKGNRVRHLSDEYFIDFQKAELRWKDLQVNRSLQT